MQKFLLWAVFHIPIGKLAPYVLKLGLGKKMKRVEL